LLLGAYLDWLQARGLQDANRLLDLAAEALRKNISSGRERLRVGGLWLDGFAEMTPQELDLLAAFLPICDRATLKRVKNVSVPTICSPQARRRRKTANCWD
jgi:hypothetical protein